MKKRFSSLLQNFRKHRQMLLVNAPAALAYLLSIVSFMLLFAFVFDALLPEPIPTRELYVNGAQAPAEPSTGMKLAQYGVTAIAVVISVAILVVLPYHLTRLYSRGVWRLVALLELPRTLQQFTLLKLIVFSLPLVGFTVATLVVPQMTATLAALTVANLVCCVVAICLVLVQTYLVRRGKTTLSRVW